MDLINGEPFKARAFTNGTCTTAQLIRAIGSRGRIYLITRGENYWHGYTDRSNRNGWVIGHVI